MTVDDIAATLPNGFHDAELSTIAIDYSAGVARLRMDVWIGDLHGSDCNTYRAATLSLSGLIYCVIEPPASRENDWQHAQLLEIDTGSVATLVKPPETSLPSVSIEGAFANWFYVRQWNSFFYISAQEASLTWEGEPVDRG